jgi:hypothetical protein
LTTRQHGLASALPLHPPAVPCFAACAAEEFALHMIIGMAKDFWQDEADEAVQEAIKDLPRSTVDEDFDLISDAAFQDHDVMMLFDMPQVTHCGVTAVAALHAGDSMCV